MTKLEIAEQKGRSIFKKFLNLFQITNYQFTKLNEVFDCKINNTIVEIKHRDDKYINYDDMLLEKNKYDSLKKLGKKILYVFTFNNNTLKIADITNINPNWTKDKFQKTNLWNKNKVEKEVGFIKNYKTYDINKSSK
jgi:hypothetical protein